MSKAIAIDAKLIHKKEIAKDVIELHFESNPHFSFLPGQFASILIPGAGPGGRDLRRAYSIASEPERKHFELCLKLVEGGPGTTYLNSLRLGDSLKAMAPFGDFVYKHKPDRAAVMIATGTGVAPFRAMLLSHLYKNSKPTTTTLLFGARNTNDLLYTEELESHLEPGRFIQALSRPTETSGPGQWKGRTGRVTDYLRENINSIEWHLTEFYLCGNGAMIDEVKQILSAQGVQKTSIHQEIYYKPKPGDAHASQD